jgi:hypothetical protein
MPSHIRNLELIYIRSNVKLGKTTNKPFVRDTNFPNRDAQRADYIAMFNVVTAQMGF